jgi:hypothetical protein
LKGAKIGVGLRWCECWEDGCVAFSFVYLAVRVLLGALVRSRRGLHVSDVELLVLGRSPAPAPVSEGIALKGAIIRLQVWLVARL